MNGVQTNPGLTFMRRSVVKKESYLNFEDELKKGNEFCTNLNRESFETIFGVRRGLIKCIRVETPATFIILPISVYRKVS